MPREVLIVGAGISGLACARELRRLGASPRILEKSRGPGGRCATWRLREQPLDYGPTFLHGADPEFLRELESVHGSTPIRGWPAVVRGEGRPCQPDAFHEDQRCLAFAEGLRVWPRRMAEGLDVRLGTCVAALRSVHGGIEAAVENGDPVTARDLVLALPAPQARALLDSLGEDSPGIASARGLLGMLGTVPCLALMAAYAQEAPRPEWDLLYPEDSPVLQLVSHDSSKRSGTPRPALVFQGLPAWSRRRLEDPAETWTGEILAEAARLVGPWAAAPVETRAHRWRYARADGGSELAGPVLVRASGGTRIGLAGESFAPGGGVQAAWISGRMLAARIVEDGEVRNP